MLVVATNADEDEHETPEWHPERAARTRAALDGLIDAGLADAVVPIGSREATDVELELVHDRVYLDEMDALCRRGGGALDPDTFVSTGSWTTARLAAGAGIAACGALRRGEGDAALVLTRPPGHHAGRSTAMGFCLINSIAVAAADLLRQGERVLVLDWDCHHGNGTQDLFWSEPRVLYASMHARHLFPGTGAWHEVGGPGAEGTTVNVPLFEGATGDVAVAALEEVIAPQAERFQPTWILVSAGFDGHRRDPMEALALTSADFADLARRVARLAPTMGRVALFLEGGYDLEALRLSVGASASAILGGKFLPEPRTTGGPGREFVTELSRRWEKGF